LSQQKTRTLDAGNNFNRLEVLCLRWCLIPRLAYGWTVGFLKDSGWFFRGFDLMVFSGLGRSFHGLGSMVFSELAWSFQEIWIDGFLRIGLTFQGFGSMVFSGSGGLFRDLD